jgi:hypothetical protein
MTNRVEDIFSPERLRVHWGRREDAATQRDEGGISPVEPQGVLEVFARLQRRVHQRFPGEQGEALHAMMNELEEMLLRRFPQKGDAEVSENDQAALNLAIEKLLNEIEDLVEALEL